MDKTTLEAISQCWSIAPSGAFDFEKAHRLIQENYIAPDLEEVLADNKTWADSCKSQDNLLKLQATDIYNLNEECAMLKADNVDLRKKVEFAEAEVMRLAGLLGKAHSDLQVFAKESPLLESKVETTPVTRGKKNEHEGDTKSTNQK